MAEESGQKENEGSCGCGGGRCGCKAKWILLALVIGAVVVVRWSKQGGAPCCGASGCALPPAVVARNAGPVAATVAAAVAPGPAEKLPRLVDLGAGKCIPCKMMAPILEELKKTYAGKLDVQFIDVWVNPDEAPKYGIQIIPTQIFFDPGGKEMFRHEGFLSREDILAKWKELGFALGATNATPAR